METMTEPTTRSSSYPADSCRALAIFAFLVLVAIGLVAANVGHLRDGDLGVDMATLGVWVGAGVICLVVGMSAAMICRQLEALRA